MASLIDDRAVPSDGPKVEVPETGASETSAAADNSTTAVVATTTTTSATTAAVADVFVFHHPECYEHHISSHPEQPDRVESILATLRHHFPAAWFKEAPMATDEQILLFHTPEHLAMIKRLCNKAEKGPPYELMSIDGDTTVMRKTRNAMYRAAGSIIAAVDAVYAPTTRTTTSTSSTSDDTTGGTARSAFCCVRPPGHHAERNRACGFCFFNNAAIGAR